MYIKVLVSLGSVALTGCNNGDKDNIALGTLERDRIAHTATVNEVIIELPVKAGSNVLKGTLLIELDNDLQMALVAQAL